MSLHDLSLKTLAIILIAAGVLIVFAISGFQARILFAPSVTEDAQVSIENEQDGSCITEGSDRVPRTISNCPYNVGHSIYNLQTRTTLDREARTSTICYYYSSSYSRAIMMALAFIWFAEAYVKNILQKIIQAGCIIF